MLGGATHHYPDETTITVTPDGVVSPRWDALKERRDECGGCATARTASSSSRGLQYHEFFGSADAEDVVCDRTVVLVPSVPSSVPAGSPGVHLGRGPVAPDLGGARRD